MSIEHACRRDIPDATVNRLPVYLRVLGESASKGQSTISSETLAAASGVSSAKLRKDLSALGSYGVRGVGYDIATLSKHITEALGLGHTWSVAIVGMGNLGTALATYGGIGVKGFDIKWLIDDNPQVVGRLIGGQSVVHFDALKPSKDERVIGIIAVPAAAAQQVADRFIKVGVRSILNFAPAVLVVPDEVQVRGVDMATELQILAFRGLGAREPHETSEMKELMA